MARGDGIQKRDTGGWWCSCPACRPGLPEPDKLLAALWRASFVEVVFWKKDGTETAYRAWTRPENEGDNVPEYVVVHETGKPGGWCKHVLAATALHFQIQWLNIAFDKIREETVECQALRKELRKARRRLARLESSSSR